MAAAPVFHGPPDLPMTLSPARGSLLDLKWLKLYSLRIGFSNSYSTEE